MTKNKARKAAARARAAATGERYVVARRAVEHEPDAGSGGVLHRLTHRVPGVPAHVEGGLIARRNRLHRPAARPQPHQGQPQQSQPQHGQVHQGQPHHGEPRVLVGWQNRIAQLLGAK